METIFIDCMVTIKKMHGCCGDVCINIVDYEACKLHLNYDQSIYSLYIIKIM